SAIRSTTGGLAPRSLLIRNQKTTSTDENALHRAAAADGPFRHDSAKAAPYRPNWGPGEGLKLLPARRSAFAATASLLVAGAFFVVPFSVVAARAEGPVGTCEDAAEIAVLPSPVAPWKGAPLRVMLAAEKPLEGELSLIAPDGRVAASSRERHGG